MSLREPERNVSARSLTIEETLDQKIRELMKHGDYLATPDELDAPGWEQSFPILLSKLENSIRRYTEKFDADRDLYGIIYLVSLGVKLSRNYGAKNNIDMVCDMLNTELPPALVHAAGLVATDQSKYGSNTLKQVGLLQKFFVRSWITGLKNMCSELDLEGIEGAPMELFQEIVHDYVVKEFEDVLKNAGPEEWDAL